MSAARGGNVGTLLPDGDVLVTGRAQTFAELYHPATGQWSSASAGLAVCLSNQECRIFSTATLLPTGNVLVAGGLIGLISNPQTTATAMLYHPDTNTWTSTGSMTTGRENQTATLLPDGRVLMAGGTLFDHPHAAISWPAPNSIPRRPLRAGSRGSAEDDVGDPAGDDDQAGHVVARVGGVPGQDFGDVVAAG